MNYAANVPEGHWSKFSVCFTTPFFIWSEKHLQNHVSHGSNLLCFLKCLNIQFPPSYIISCLKTYFFFVHFINFTVSPRLAFYRSSVALLLNFSVLVCFLLSFGKCTGIRNLDMCKSVIRLQ